MKKYLLFVIIVLVLLTGCGKNQEIKEEANTNMNTTSTTKETTTKEITETAKTTTASKNISNSTSTSRSTSTKTTKELAKINLKTTKTTTTTVCNHPSESEVYNVLMSRKSIYPDGTSWDETKYFQWKGGIYISGKGSIAFAFLLSDAAFGSCQATKHQNFSNIRVGDIVVLNNESSSFIVLKANSDSYTIAEGNKNGVVKWESTISKSEVQSTADFVLTRW